MYMYCVSRYHSVLMVIWGLGRYGFQCVLSLVRLANSICVLMEFALWTVCCDVIKLGIYLSLK